MSMETQPPAPKTDKLTKTANGLANKADSTQIVERSLCRMERCSI